MLNSGPCRALNVKWSLTMFDRRRRAALHELARRLGVATRFTDGLGNRVEVSDQTLVEVCRALGAEIDHPRDARGALRAVRVANRVEPAVGVAWDGRLDRRVLDSGPRSDSATLRLDPAVAGGSRTERPLADFDDGSGVAVVPSGVHHLTIVDAGGEASHTTIIAAPLLSWRPPDADPRRWGIAVHLAALRSARSRSVGDLTDLRALADTVASAGGSVVSVLPILPTFNDAPAEPSPYSPVSRLFWSELALDVGDGTGAAIDRVDVTTAAAEVRRAFETARAPIPAVDAELAAYARFRGAQARLGRDWRTWPAAARDGRIHDDHVDADEERFHLAAQTAMRDQLSELRHHLDAEGVVLGLDLAVGVHPDGYDVWSRPHLFAGSMAVGAPPDAGFPSGQNWGFNPVLPDASAAEGHRYLRATIAHQASLAGVLRIDHIMALRRLYWIPDGMPLDRGTYVSYPMEELLALLSLESHLHACEIVGENLGTVPPELDAALDRHAIRGMSVAQFSAGAGRPVDDVSANEVAYLGTHDTPTFAGWLDGSDIDLRVRLGLLAPDVAPAVRADRERTVQRLAVEVGGSVDDPATLLELVLGALGASPSPMVLLWLEDLWLEPHQVNVPGTSSAQHPNWQRPMRRRYDEALMDPDVARLLRVLDRARLGPGPGEPG